MIRAAIVTISDSCAEGQRDNHSGPAAREMLEEEVFHVCQEVIVPDNRQAIARALIRLADEWNCGVVITTGGTGLGPRDVTPEATTSICDRLVPGIAELVRVQGFRKTPNAALSRGIAGIRGGTLIVNLPGSPKAVRESLECLVGILPHAVEMMRGGGH